MEPRKRRFSHCLAKKIKTYSFWSCTLFSCFFGTLRHLNDWIKASIDLRWKNYLQKSSKSKVKIAVFNLFLQFFYDTVSNKKTHLVDLELVFFEYMSGTTWATKSYLHPCMKSFHLKKYFFQIRSQNQLIFVKTMFCQKKCKLWEKTHHFEKLKIFFSWI